MSGDVTAAIERLREFSRVNLFKSYIHEDGRYTVSHDIDTVLAAYEAAEHGASLEEVRADHHRNQHYSNSVAMADAVLRADRAERSLERMQEERDQYASSDAILWGALQTWKPRAHRAESRLEAVAALHFETDGVHTHTVCAHRYCVDDSHDQHQWPCPTAIAAGLTSDPEADQ